MIVLFVATFLLFPLLLIVACQRFPFLDKLGTVLLAFGIGIMASALVDFSSLFVGVDVVATQTQITELAIALALPMLLFSVDIKAAFSLAGKTTKSMGIALLTVMLMSALLAWVFKGDIDHIWQVAGMSVGAYTGGGPNMAAISAAIEGDKTVFVTMTTYDILLSAIYLLFVMSVAKPLFSRVLKPFDFESVPHEGGSASFDHMADESANAFKVIVQKGRRLESLKSVLLSGVAVGLALALASVFPEGMRSAATIILITSMGLVFSFVPFIRKLTNSFQIGMYLILVFCFTMGAMTNIEMLMNLNLYLFAYIGLILLGSLCLHALFCRLFDIDTDTFLITSSAAIMSVPFIPVIAGALKNREIILPGFAAAILGYILGNYLGVAMAYFTRWMLGG